VPTVHDVPVGMVPVVVCVDGSAVSNVDGSATHAADHLRGGRFFAPSFSVAFGRAMIFGIGALKASSAMHSSARDRLTGGIRGSFRQAGFRGRWLLRRRR
jgi:hypothetical protein